MIWQWLKCSSFPLFLCIDRWGRLSYLSLLFFSLLAMLWNSAFRCLYLSFSPLLLASLPFTAICKASSDSHFTFWHFFYLGMGLIPVSCTRSRISVCSSSGTLSIKSSLKSICHFHCTIIRYLIYVIPEWSSDFPYFNLRLNLSMRSSWSEP